MVASAQIKKSQKAARKATTKDAVIGMNLIRTEKNVLIQNIKKGLPVSAFEKIQKELDVSSDTLASAVNIASRTLARRKKEGRFPSIRGATTPDHECGPSDIHGAPSTRYTAGKPPAQWWRDRPAYRSSARPGRRR